MANGHKTDIRLLMIVIAAATSVLGGGAATFNAFSPQELAQEDHDRIVRIEEKLISMERRQDADDLRDGAQDVQLADHATRLHALDIHMDYMRGDEMPLVPPPPR